MFVSYEKDFVTQARFYSFLNLWDDFVLPERSNPLFYHFEGFSFWHTLMLFFVKVLVHTIKSRVTLIIVADKWWRVVVWLSPEFDLLFAVDLGRLYFAKTLEGTVVSLVDLPWLESSCSVRLLHFVKDVFASFTCSAKPGSKCNVKIETSILELFASKFGFVLADFVERDINPAAEFLGFVPFGLTVSDKYYLKAMMWLCLFLFDERACLLL